MTARGHVRNGVVILDDGVHLPEGQEVTVLAEETAAAVLPTGAPHGVLDIPTISLGLILAEGPADGDLLAEMLDDGP